MVSPNHFVIRWLTRPCQATDMSIRLREMAYHKIKLNKILSRITGKPLEQVCVYIVSLTIYLVLSFLLEPS